MPIPVSNHRPAPPAAPAPTRAQPQAGAPRAATARLGAADARREATDQVEAARTQRAAPRPPATFDRAIRSLARTYLEGTTSSVREVLANDPRMVAALANASPEEIHSALVAEFERVDDTFHDSMRADNVMSVVTDTVSNLVRHGVMREARVTTRARMRELGQLANDVPATVERLRQAAPGSADAALAELLGVRGDAGDAERVRTGLQTAIQGLDEFHSRIQGNSWEPSDFPSATGRAMRRMGIDPDAHGSLGDEVAHAEDESHEHVGHAAHMIDGLHILAEGRHFAHLAAGVESLAVGVGLATSVVGLAVGIAVTHLAENQHEEFIAAGHALGL